MAPVNQADVGLWINHINKLAGEIGPRGSTTEKEREAADYAFQNMKELGLNPKMDSFTSATSGYQPHLYAAIFTLIAFAVYPLGRIGAIFGAVLAAGAIISESLEMLFLPNPLRWLITKGQSQNVHARLEPAGEHKQDLILLGHLDTNRTPWIFSSTFATDIWRVVGPVVFLSMNVFAILYVVGLFVDWAWIWPVSAFNVLAVGYLGGTTFQAELTPYSPGANDNATAAGLVLTLASVLKKNPLKHTRVWFVNTGCEEVKHYGAIDFFERYKPEFHNPMCLAFEMLGRDDPGWVDREVILPPFFYYADRNMKTLLQEVSDTNPEWNASATIVHGGHTEMADALRVGIPAITLIGISGADVPLGYSGPELYWHRIDDTPDKINHEVLERAYGLSVAYNHALDDRAVS